MLSKKAGLARALFLILTVFSSVSYGNAEQAAIEAAVKAGTRQLGIDEMLNDWVKSKVPREYLKLAAQVAPVVEAASTGTITLTWELK